MHRYKDLILESGICFEVFDQMLDEILFFDVDLLLTYLNPAAERSEGYTLEEAYGRSLFELYDFHDDVRKDTSPAYIALTEKRRVRDMICTYCTNGLKKTKSISSTPIFKNGRLAGVFNIQHDYTHISNMIDENLQLQSRIGQQSADPSERQDPFGYIIGASAPFVHCLSLAKKAASTDSPVLLTGEGGCGKDTFARAIHRGSPRAAMPFLSINCASIPADLSDGLLFGIENTHYLGPDSEGLLAQVDKGTLYIEQITYMPAAVQVRLLRALEQRSYVGPDGRVVPLDLRIICSSDKPVTEIIRDGCLDMDFFYYISIVQISLPALRERKEDIPLLAGHFLAGFNERFHKQIPGLSQEATSWLRIYQWPGNIRQFRSCIEAAMNLAEDGRAIRADDLPANIFYGTENAVSQERPTTPAPKKPAFSKRQLYLDARDQEREEIISALTETGGNISQAARILGISRQLMYYRMKKYHID